jgi:uncharacterized membrane protein
MIRSILMGAVAGARAMTPLAVLAQAARGSGRGSLLATGTLALAAGELAGDKLKQAPDRVEPAGIVGRVLSGALAGAACAPRGERVAGAMLGAAAAVAASHLTFRLRAAAARRYGQAASGLIEDGLAVGGALLLAQR